MVKKDNNYYLKRLTNKYTEKIGISTKVLKQAGVVHDIKSQ